MATRKKFIAPKNPVSEVTLDKVVDRAETRRAAGTVLLLTVYTLAIWVILTNPSVFGEERDQLLSKCTDGFILAGLAYWLDVLSDSFFVGDWPMFKISMPVAFLSGICATWSFLLLMTLTASLGTIPLN